MQALTSYAQVGNTLIIPQAQSNFGQDSVRINGFECSTSVSSQKNLETGVLAAQSQYNNYNPGMYGGSTYTPAVTGGVYARVIIPLDGKRNRPDCNRLFEIELEKRALELEMYKKNMATPKDDEFKR
jgi:hypothetical protein